MKIIIPVLTKCWDLSQVLLTFGGVARQSIIMGGDLAKMFTSLAWNVLECAYWHKILESYEKKSLIIIQRNTIIINVLYYDKHKKLSIATKLPSYYSPFLVLVTLTTLKCNTVTTVAIITLLIIGMATAKAIKGIIFAVHVCGVCEPCLGIGRTRTARVWQKEWLCAWRAMQAHVLTCTWLPVCKHVDHCLDT